MSILEAWILVGLVASGMWYSREYRSFKRSKIDLIGLTIVSVILGVILGPFLLGGLLNDSIQDGKEE